MKHADNMTTLMHGHIVLYKWYKDMAEGRGWKSEILIRPRCHSEPRLGKVRFTRESKIFEFELRATDPADLLWMYWTAETEALFCDGRPT